MILKNLGKMRGQLWIMMVLGAYCSLKVFRKVIWLIIGPLLSMLLLSAFASKVGFGGSEGGA